MISSNEIRLTKPTRSAAPKLEVKLSVPLPRRLDLSKPIQAMLAGLLLFTLVVPVLEAAMLHQRYRLRPGAARLLTGPSTVLADKLQYDAAAKAYKYNGATAEGGQASLQVRAGRFAAEIPVDSRQGIKLTDPQSDLSIKATPQFSAMEGREQDGHIVYPLSANSNQLVYTLKGNGVKEDIVVNRYAGEELAFSYKLELPAQLEAKMMESGGVGIYSADPLLFGNVSSASEEDKEMLEKARTGGEKNHLAFALPAPVILESGQGGQTKAVFELKDGLLTVRATGLRNAIYPLVIDPSFVVTSASDFQKGNSESNIDFDAGGQLKRGGLTGGQAGSWTGTGSGGAPCGNGLSFDLPVCRSALGVAVWNNYIYAVAGCGTPYACTTSATSTVYYAKLSDAGGFQAPSGCSPISPSTYWCQATSMTTARYDNRAVAYNGYLYAIGGRDSAGSPVTSLEYAKINPHNGSLVAPPGCGSTWCTANAPVTARIAPEVGASNGFMYVWGGHTGSATTASVEYAAVGGDGSLAAWTATTSMGSGQERAWFGGAIYNDYIYAVAGYSTQAGANHNGVRYAKVNSDGTVGTWGSATNFPNSISANSVTAYNGYLYSHGNTGATSNFNYYAPINADGSLGSWEALTTFTTGSNTYGYGRMAAANNSLYFVGGNGDNTGQNGAVNYQVRYSLIDVVGVLSNPATVNAFTSARWGHSTLVRGGRIHIWGGCTESHQLSNSCVAPLDIGTTTGGTNGYMTAPINADGTLGTWTSPAVACVDSLNLATSCPVARFGHTGAFVPGNGRYVLVSGATGGVTDTFTTDVWSTSFDASSGIANTWKLFQNSNLNTPAVSSFLPRVYATSYGNDLSITVVAGGEVTGTTATPVNTIITNHFTSGSAMNGWTAITVNGTFTARWKAAVGYYLSKGTNYLYQIGGLDSGGSVLSNIQVGAQSGGSITFSTACSPCTGLTGRFGASAMVWKDRLVVAGGTSSTANPPASYLSDISQATISTNGTLSNFSQIGTLTTARYAHGFGATNFGDYLYVAGGLSNTGVGGAIEPQSSVQKLKINNGGTGTLGAWSTNSTSMTARYKFGFAQWGRYLYLVGGLNSSGAAISTTAVCTIADDYTVSCTDVSDTGALGNIAYNSAAVVPNDSGGAWLYSFGGEDGSATLTNRVMRRPIDSNGSLTGSWVDTGQNLTPTGGATGIEYTAATVGYAGTTPYVYVYGGRTTSSNQNVTRDVERASVDPATGSLSAWTVQANYLNATGSVGIRSMALYSYGNQILNYGGMNVDLGNDTNINRSLRVDSINQSTGALTASGASVGPNQFGGGLVAENGHMFLLGGLNSLSTLLATGSTTALHPDGASGEYQSAQNHPTSVGYAGTAIYKGRVYILGGCKAITTGDTCNSSADVLSSYQMTTYQAPARVSRYSRLLDSDLDSTPTKMLINGALFAANSSKATMRYKRASSAAPTLTGETSYDPLPFGALQTVPTDSTKMARYYWLHFTMDDSNVAGFPDINQTAISEVLLYYHPATSRRLRGGKTFTGQQQQSLDASP